MNYQQFDWGVDGINDESLSSEDFVISRPSDAYVVLNS